MYLRLVRFRMKPQMIEEGDRFYREEAIPTLEKTPGCRFARWIQNTQDPEECVSLTLWESPGHIEAYERGGTFRGLLDRFRPLIAESSEWKMELSEDLTLDMKPIPEEPVVQSFAVSAAMETDRLVCERGDMMCVRILSVRLKPGMLDEFRRRYNEEIIPVMRTVQGCRYDYLAEGAQETILSVTIWDSRADAEAYERSGRFDALTDKLKHMFTGLSQWKLTLDPATRDFAATSEDLQIESYTVVRGSPLNIR